MSGGPVTLLDEVLEAHGGLERWAARARDPRPGPLRRAADPHPVPGNRFATCRLEVAAPSRVGSADAVSARRAGAASSTTARSGSRPLDGEVLESREHPRELFFGRAGLRRNLRWDALDSIYFAGYALVNYLTPPFLLTRDGVARARDRALARGRRDLAPARGALPGRHRHPLASASSSTTTPTLRLRRHDYTAEVVGGWARAAHMCADHVEVGGLVFPTRRWVRPVGPGQPAAAGPDPGLSALSEIEVDEPPSRSRSSGTSRSRTTARRRAGRSPTRRSSTSAGRRSRARTSPIALWLTRGAAQDLPVLRARRPQHRRLDRDHRGARAALARVARCTRMTRPSAAGRSSSRTSSTRSSARRSACSPGTCCAPTASGWSELGGDDAPRAAARQPARAGGRAARFGSALRPAALPGRRRRGRRRRHAPRWSRRSTGSRPSSTTAAASTSSATRSRSPT